MGQELRARRIQLEEVVRSHRLEAQEMERRHTKELEELRTRQEEEVVAVEEEAEDQVEHLRKEVELLENELGLMAPEIANPPSSGGLVEPGGLTQFSILKTQRMCLQGKGVAPARGTGICKALKYAVPLPPKPDI